MALTRPPALKHVLIAGDAIAIVMSLIIALLWGDDSLSHLFTSFSPTLAAKVGLLLLGGLAITLVAIAAERLYLSRVAAMRSQEIGKIVRVCIYLMVVAIAAGRLFGVTHQARFPMLVGATLFVFLNLWRSTFASWLANQRRLDRYTRPILLIGTNDDALRLRRLLETHPELGYRITGIVGNLQEFAQRDFGNIPYVGGSSELPQILATHRVTGAVVAGTAQHQAMLNRTIRTLLDHNVHVQMSTGLSGIDQRRMRGQSFAYEPIVYLESAHLDPWQVRAKRAMDVFVSLTVLVITTPILLFASLIIKLTDGGPVLFFQQRVGHHGKSFRIYKLRSMGVDAESRKIELIDLNQRQGPLFKVAADPRVTRIGRILRATSIDELPQLFNVLRGDMSLVGPRPALPEEVATFNDEHLARHNVQPGITGLWQIEARDNPDFWLYQRFDIFYVENWSIFLDINILVATARVVASRALRSVFRAFHRRRRSVTTATPVIE